MPKGKRLPISSGQLEIIKGQVRQGLKAKAIFLSNQQILHGLGAKVIVSAIQRIIRREGLTDKKRSELVSQAPRLTPEKKQQLLEVMRGTGKDLPDSAVALEMRVSSQSVYWLRTRTIGKVQGPKRRYSAVIEQERRKKISRSYAQKRKRLYNALYSLQDRLEAERFRAPLKDCNVCGDLRFETGDFFQKTTQKKKNGDAYFPPTCRICLAEMDFLKRGGKRREEILKQMRELYRLKPERARGELECLLRIHTKQRCVDRLVRCRHCRTLWFWNRQYFRVINGNGGVARLTECCLACPALRRFFSK